MKISSLAVLVLPAMLLMGCESGPVSQEDQVTNFVAALNNEGGRFSVSKAISLQGGYSVILDRGTIFAPDRHFAIDVMSYNAFSYSGYGYLQRMTTDGRVYNNLTSLGNGDYLDPRSGTTFNKVTDESMLDSATAEAINKAEKSLKIAAVLQDDFSMSEEASLKAGAILSGLNSDSSYEQINSAVKSITGSSLQDLQAAMGNPSAEKAALAKLKENGISVASINAIVDFMSSI